MGRPAGPRVRPSASAGKRGTAPRKACIQVGKTQAAGSSPPSEKDPNPAGCLGVPPSIDEEGVETGFLSAESGSFSIESSLRDPSTSSTSSSSSGSGVLCAAADNEAPSDLTGVAATPPPRLRLPKLGAGAAGAAAAPAAGVVVLPALCPALAEGELLAGVEKGLACIPGAPDTPPIAPNPPPNPPPVLAAVEPPPRDKLVAKPVLVLLVGNAAGEAAAAPEPLAGVPKLGATAVPTVGADAKAGADAAAEDDAALAAPNPDAKLKPPAEDEGVADAAALPAPKFRLNPANPLPLLPLANPDSVDGAPRLRLPPKPAPPPSEPKPPDEAADPKAGPALGAAAGNEKLCPAALGSAAGVAPAAAIFRLKSADVSLMPCVSQGRAEDAAAGFGAAAAGAAPAAAIFRLKSDDVSLMPCVSHGRADEPAAAFAEAAGFAASAAGFAGAAVLAEVGFAGAATLAAVDPGVTEPADTVAAAELAVAKPNTGAVEPVAAVAAEAAEAAAKPKAPRPGGFASAAAATGAAGAGLLPKPKGAAAGAVAGGAAAVVKPKDAGASAAAPKPGLAEGADDFSADGGGWFSLEAASGSCVLTDCMICAGSTPSPTGMLKLKQNVGPAPFFALSEDCSADALSAGAVPATAPEPGAVSGIGTMLKLKTKVAPPDARNERVVFGVLAIPQDVGLPLGSPTFATKIKQHRPVTSPLLGRHGGTG